MERIKAVLRVLKETITHFIRVVSKFVVRVLALSMVINIIVFVVAPTAIIPIYQLVNNIAHNKKVETHADVHRIFNNLKKELPSDYARHLKLVISPSNTVNAYAFGDGTVVITTAMLRKIDYDEGAVSAVLGHEIAHVVLNHHKSIGATAPNRYENNQFKELMADNFGLLLAKGAGYNGCNGKYVWLIFSKTYGDQLITTSHPSSLYRYHNLQRLCKKMI